MRCPKCNILEDKVIDSRSSRDGGTIRRRRECTGCGHRFTTREHVEAEDLLVVKSDDVRQAFSREKLLRGVLRAFEKRPVPREAIEKLVDEVVNELQSMNTMEISSKLIGLKVMERIPALDKVAYVRFASVYRRFEAIGEFIEEINHMERLGPKGHPELFGGNTAVSLNRAK
jgi:transcriptional repressor NrdR